MAFSSPFTAVAGGTILAANWNTGGRDNINAIWVFSAAGDMSYATSSTALSKLTIGAAYSRLRVNAGATAPEWGGALPRVAITTDGGATPAPNADTTDEYVLTAMTSNPTFGVPSGVPIQGQKLVIRVKASGAQTMAWNAIYRAFEVPLPVNLASGKTAYIAYVYNATDIKWDCANAIAVEQ